MDEYERLELELEELYKKYVMKYSWLAYLEQQLEELERIEHELKLVKFMYLFFFVFEWKH